MPAAIAPRPIGVFPFITTIGSAGRVAGKCGEQKSVGNHHIAPDERRQNLVFQPVPEIRRVQETKFLLSYRTHGLPGLYDGFNEFR